MLTAALNQALRHDRWVVVGALVAITALALGYTWWLATGFDMSAMMSPEFISWSPNHFVFMLAMWIVMMVGMMTPSVAPMLLLYVAVGRQSGQRGQPFASAAWFFTGYLLAWTAFALAATALQWWLESLAIVTPMMAGASRTLGGISLVCVGIYQWSPFKASCLSQCAAPLSFVQRHGGFQASARGSIRLGLLHGGYCIGCCWAAMTLLFAFGVMNLTWIAGLMIVVLLEKIVPYPLVFSRVAGAAAMIAGGMLIAH